MFADLQQQQPGTSAAERESKAEPESPLQAEEAEEAEGSMVPWPARSSSSRCSAPANEAAQAEAALVPALPAYNYGLLNMECITNILRFVAEEDFAACLTVCRDWLLAGRDPALPFWRVLPTPPAPQTRVRRCGVVVAQRPRRLCRRELDARKFQLLSLSRKSRSFCGCGSSPCKGTRPRPARRRRLDSGPRGKSSWSDPRSAAPQL